MKTDKPERISINAKIDLSGKGGFTTTALHLLTACKQLDKADYLTFDGSYCYPVRTLSAILGTYAKDSIVHIHPVTAWRPDQDEVFVENSAESYIRKEDKRGHYEWKKTLIPIYNVIELRERWNGNRRPEASKQRVYPQPCNVVTVAHSIEVLNDSNGKVTKWIPAAHVAELTTEEVTDKPINDTWVGLATSKDDARPALMVHGGNFATDGFRLHYSPDLPELPHELRTSCIKDILGKARNNSNTITLNQRAVKELITACKLAKKNKHALRMSVNGSLELTIPGDDGDTIRSITEGYTHSGADLKTAINPRFLMEAIDKPGNITIKLVAECAPVYITDGHREAVVMALNVKDGDSLK